MKRASQRNLDSVAEAVDKAETKIVEKQAEVNQVQGIRNGGTAANGRQQRVGARTQRFIDQAELEAARLEVLDAKHELKLAKKELDEANKINGKKIEEYNNWCAKFPRKEEELLQRAREISLCGADYLRKQFLEPNGDMYNAKKAADCCNTLFNPLWLKGKENDIAFVEANLVLLDEFGFSDFKGNFQERLKAEIPRIIERANNPMVFDWEGFDKSKLFQTRLERRKRRLGEHEVDEDWKKDLGEVATRIWEWWRPIVAEGNKEFPAFKFALKRIALLQVSSCDVERVFSQLKLVRDRCNDNLLEDMLEVRLFALCNGNLKSLLIKAWEFPLEDVDEDDE